LYRHSRFTLERIRIVEMKTLITGAGGFIGSHLAERCVEMGYEVRAFVRYNSSNSWGWLDNSKHKHHMEIVLGDIRDFDSVARAVKGRNVIFHLAALIGIPYSLVSPLAYVKTNIEGTYNVLEAAKNANVESVIITSTSETYGTAQYVPIDEKHPNVGQSPYAASKISADQLAVSYHRSFRLPVRIVRPFNTFGPRQSARAVIPTIIAQVLGGKDEIRLGNLKPTRDLTFVKDTANAFVEIQRSKSLDGETINVGMNMEVSIEELVTQVCDMTGKKVSVISDDERIRPDNCEVERLVCDNRKILSRTHWRPAYDLRSGLKETIEWCTGHLYYYKAEVYNV
jgi:NAD dependent epimerase/dehydratase